MLHQLTTDEFEQAQVTANIVAAALARLEREYGDPAVMEALRLIISALPTDRRRREIMRALVMKECGDPFDNLSRDGS